VHYPPLSCVFDGLTGAALADAAGQPPAAQSGTSRHTRMMPPPTKTPARSLARDENQVCVVGREIGDATAPLGQHCGSDGLSAARVGSGSVPSQTLGSLGPSLRTKLSSVGSI
jgi:hypothetical protein